MPANSTMKWAMKWQWMGLVGLLPVLGCGAATRQGLGGRGDGDGLNHLAAALGGGVEGA